MNVHYIPVHTQPYYQRLGFREGDFPQAEAYYRQAISLPRYPTMSEARQDGVVSVLRGLLALISVVDEREGKIGGEESSDATYKNRHYPRPWWQQAYPA